MITKAARRRLRKNGERGAAAMELAMLLPIFILFIVGIMDFGHAWYIHHTITNASREAARFGIRYPGTGPAPNDAAIRKVARDYLKQFFPADFVDGEVTVEPTWVDTNPGPATPPPAAGHGAGDDLTVTVTAPKEWILLGYLIGLDTVTITAATTMMVQ